MHLALSDFLAVSAGPDSHRTAQMEKRHTQTLALQPHTRGVDGNYKPIVPPPAEGQRLIYWGFHLTALPRSSRADGKGREAESNGQIEIEGGMQETGSKWVAEIALEPEIRRLRWKEMEGQKKERR